MTVLWDDVTRDHVLRSIQDYDRLGADGFFAAHGFAPTTTYDLVWDGRCYPPKAILGTAYEFATGQRLASGDFEGGKSGAVKVLGALGFDVQPRSRLEVKTHRACVRPQPVERAGLVQVSCLLGEELTGLAAQRVPQHEPGHFFPQRAELAQRLSERR